MLTLLALVGCDYTGDWLFAAGVEGVDDVYELLAPDGSAEFVPVDIQVVEDIAANVVYAEVSASTSTAGGGVTATFRGTGNSVCVWVDPETVYWTQAVAAKPTDSSKKYDYPDNLFDDGDIDLTVGQSLFYTGSPGVEIGDFKVNYDDQLGNPITISLQECVQTDYYGDPFGSGGRGTPEYCTINSTLPGVSYTILMRTFSTPLDDDRLSFGFLLTDGTCASLINTGDVGTPAQEECLIRQESIAAGQVQAPGPWYGLNEVEGLSWPGVFELEDAYCDLSVNMRGFCNDEVQALADADRECVWDNVDDPDSHCFCGDPQLTPEGGGI